MSREDKKSGRKRKEGKKDKEESTKGKKQRRKALKRAKPVVRKKVIVRKESRTPLKARKKVKKRKPAFPRQESYRLVKIKGKWRRPRGRHSKLRKGEKARGKRPTPGYGSPKSVRGLTRHGYREVRVSNPAELERLDPKKDAALISGSVGNRKRQDIMRKATELDIHVLNQ